MAISKSTLEKLKKAAIKASKASYSPYSKFSVGAAILMEKGKIFSGTNIENAAYGLAICAERVAIVKAVSEGYKNIQAVVVYTPTKTATGCCGACRQFIHEFGPNCEILSFCDSKKQIATTCKEFLPYSFGPENL